MNNESLAEWIPFDCRPHDGIPWVLRVERVEPFIPDAFDTLQHDMALWLMGVAMGDRVRLKLTRVWRVLVQYSDMMRPDLALILALFHRQSPFAIEHQYPGPNAVRIVGWRGRFYTRDQHGVLTPAGDDQAWP